MGLQTIAHNLVAAHSAAGQPPRAAIITPLAPPAILPQLLDVLRAQVGAKAPSAHKRADTSADEMASRYLQRITLSRVFDVEGLHDVLHELEIAPQGPAGAGIHPAPTPGRHGDNLAFCDAPTPAPGQRPESGSASDGAPEPTPALGLPPPIHRDSPTSLPARNCGPSKTGRTEIMDSEDEGNLLSSSSPFSSPPLLSDPPTRSSRGGVSAQQEDEQAMVGEEATRQEATSHISSDRGPEEQGGADGEYRASPFDPEPGLSLAMPDIILITHMPTLLSHLFTSRDKEAAQMTTQLLSAHLQCLSRSAGPLILLLNSTTTSTIGATSAVALGSASPWPGRLPLGPGSAGSRPLDPTLRSIFSPPPPSHQGYRPHGSAGASAAPSRQNKPAFGLTFTQLLDLHLLCTKMPRTRLDAATGGGLARHAWAVEVLLDKDGLWDAPNDDDEPPGRRVDREQRWGAVDVRDGVRIVDAFG